MFIEKIKTATVAVGIGIACFLPAITQAQESSGSQQVQQSSGSQSQGSGRSNIESNVFVTFSLNPSIADIADTNQDPNVGEFPRAIQNFTNTGNQALNINLTELSFPIGNLRTSRLTTDPTTGNFPGLSLNYRAITNSSFPYAAFNNDGLRYDVTFPNATETLTLFIPSPPNNFDLINSLSDFTDFLRSVDNTIQGVVSRPNNVDIQPENFIVTNPDTDRRGFTFATVSEPNATASLLGIGALGAVALLGRNQRLRKPV